MNNKVRLIIITITLILGILLINKMQNRQEELYKVNLKNKVDKNLVSILVSDKEGNYNLYESNTFPSKEDYTYNSELSKCQDNNGNVINGILSYNEITNKVSVRTKKTTYCYLYFDYVPKSVDASGANPPVLASGMIPVYYDRTDSSWHKADVKNANEQYKWYDYNAKMWANAVTVTSANRATYQSAAVGTKIADGDINTMFVWIPRYKYTVWNYNADGTVSSSPQEIKVTFESGKNKSGEITCTDSISKFDGRPSETCKVNDTECTNALCNGKTYTHPAFSFGSDELTGFWVGKFEITGTISAITVRPNLASIRKQKLSIFFSNIAAMKNAGNAYGFATSDDTHMIKNSEWGAVAYLNYSKYGTCTNGTCAEITLNSNISFITGGNAYLTNVNQTTTGNIYGIYDMTGGAWEYTMGNTVESSGTVSNAAAGSFSSSDKYVDKYSYSSSYATIKRSKLGDGIKEVYVSSNTSWNNDYGYLTSSATTPWFGRGANHYFSDNPGIFHTYYFNGAADDSRSTRVTISIP